MPDMNGLKFLETVKEEKEIDIPFIMFTGKGREEVAMEALNMGAERYLKKGGDPKSQYAVLSDAIEQEWELYRKNKELKKSEKEKSLILESTSEIIAYHDKDHNIKWANEAYREVSGLSQEELEGKKCHQAWGHEMPCENCPVTKAIETGEPTQAELSPETQKQWSSDDPYWLIKGSPVKDSKGDIIGAVEVASDITERKKAEKELRKSKEKYKALFYETPLGVFRYDDKGIITECNDKFVEIIGSSRETLIGLDMINDLEDEKLIEEIKSSLAEGEGYYEGDYTSVTGDKTTAVRVIFKGMRNEEGKIYAGMGLIEDVSERKNKEKELLESREKYRELLESVDVAIIVHDSEGKIISANSAAEEFMGMKEEDLKRKGLGYWEGILYTENRETMDIKDFPVSTVLESKEAKRGDIIGISQPDSQKISWYIISAEPHFDEKGKIKRITTSFKDITQMKKFEDKIKENEQRYRRLFETAQDGMLILDALSGEIMDANPFIRDMTGYSLEELKGKKLWEIGTFRDIAENKEKFDELRKEEYVRYEHLPLKTKDGEEKSVEFVSNLYDVAGRKVIQCNIRDVSERKEAEEREEFLHSLLRHNLQNKSQVILGYLQMLEDLELSEEMKEYTEKAKDVTKEGINVIEKVRKLRKIDEKSEFRLVNIDSILDDVISNYQGQLEDKDIKIETEICEDTVKGGALLEELFSNIIENAINHSNSNKISIKSKAKGDECIITIEDDGRGIPDDKKDKIFEKGFKEGEEAGTGLGMYMAKKIVENYGGNIEVKDSKLGGARFDVILKVENE